MYCKLSGIIHILIFCINNRIVERWKILWESINKYFEFDMAFIKSICMSFAIVSF